VWCAGLMAPAGACIWVLNSAADRGVPPRVCWLVQAGGFCGVPGCLGPRCAGAQLCSCACSVKVAGC
jgi:hypothetical protein